jgi:hypothetical protein
MIPAMASRDEQEIFEELARLVKSPGYIHAISLLCFRDNYIHFGAELKAQDMDRLYSHSRLIRSELTTLIGLLIRGSIEFSHPGIGALQEYIERTEALLIELHGALGATMFNGLFETENASAAGGRLDLAGSALREPIFYGGESAYGFQYRDLAAIKYRADDPWLRAHLGFSIGDARKVVIAVAAVLDKKMKNTQGALASMPRDAWTMLPGFAFTTDEVAVQSDLSFETAGCVLDAFAFAGGDANAGFTSLHAFNAASGTPLLRAEAGQYILLQQYSLFEALYESPFFWLGADKTYEATALFNRGHFVEAFACERLEKVFGKAYVYPNVDIWKSKGQKIGEIDTLVIFGDRAIVLQAKSKRLTLEARKGNDFQIKDDFKKAVQQSFDQAFLCATALIGLSPNLTDAQGNAIVLRQSLKMVYPVCIVADHYPALSFQARQFLKAQTAPRISAPLVTDVFALDAMTEMLESPLRLLSYFELRARFGDRLMSSHELTFLAFHLKRNLWLNDEYDFVMLEDDIAADLDIAMGARREGLPGLAMPEGIFTRTKNTAVGSIIAEIEALPDASTIDLGLLLLELGEETVEDISRGIIQICAGTRRDGKNHDFTVGLGTASAGLTIHCNPRDGPAAQQSLQAHCAGRKYKQKAQRWFGLVLRPDQALWFGLKLDFPWAQDAHMDEATSLLSQTATWHRTVGKSDRSKSPGRNDKCPCGSDKKYKKCCLFSPGAAGRF